MSALADERLIAAPRVEADAVEPDVRHTFERALHLQPQPENVPAQRPLLPDRLVREPADLVDVEHAGAKPSEDRAPAFCAEIEGEHMRTHARSIRCRPTNANRFPRRAARFGLRNTPANGPAPV